MSQKTIDNQDAAKIASLGIECFVKCVSNKVDQAKEDIRSLCLNFDIKADVDGDIKLMGKGNNLNINNLTPDAYAAMCRAFGVDKIDESTPFVAVLYKTSDRAKQQEWIKERSRTEKKISPDQADVTEFPKGKKGKAAAEKKESIAKGQEKQKRIPDDKPAAKKPKK